MDELKKLRAFLDSKKEGNRIEERERERERGLRN